MPAAEALTGEELPIPPPMGESLLVLEEEGEGELPTAVASPPSVELSAAMGRAGLIMERRVRTEGSVLL